MTAPRRRRIKQRQKARLTPEKVIKQRQKARPTPEKVIALLSIKEAATEAILAIILEGVAPFAVPVEETIAEEEE